MKIILLKLLPSVIRALWFIIMWHVTRGATTHLFLHWLGNARVTINSDKTNAWCSLCTIRCSRLRCSEDCSQTSLLDQTSHMQRLSLKQLVLFIQQLQSSRFMLKGCFIMQTDLRMWKIDSRLVLPTSLPAWRSVVDRCRRLVCKINVLMWSGSKLKNFFGVLLRYCSAMSDFWIRHCSSI